MALNTNQKIMIPVSSNNYFGISTLNGSGVAGSAISVLGNSLSITGITESIPLSQITKYSRSVYAAGTKAKKTITLTNMVILDNTEYQISVQRTGSPASKKTYTIFTGISFSVTNVADAFRAAIAADLQAYVVGTGTTTIILEMADTASDFTIDITAISASTQAVTTAYVEPSGTTAIVGAIDPLNVSATGNYITYQITYKRAQRSSVVNGAFVNNEVTVIVFADGAVANVTAAKKAEFDSKLVSVLTSPGGRAGFAPTVITTNATYNAVLADNFIVYNYAGANTINLPDSASYGDGMLVIMNPSNSTVTVGKTTGGDTLIGTNSTSITTTLAGIYMNSAAITTWARIV